MKINVGICRKVGLPEYSSAGADCHVELDVDGLLLTHGVDGLQAHIAQAFDACRAAVEAELARLTQPAAPAPAPEPAPAPAPNGNGSGYNNGSRANGGGGWGPTNGNGNGNGGRSNGTAAATAPLPASYRPAEQRRNSPSERLPETGNQLLGWMRTMARQRNGFDFTPSVIEWGKQRGIKGMVLHWNPYEVADAVAEVQARIAEMQQRNGVN
jgi:hypothetical protein